MIILMHCAPDINWGYTLVIYDHSDSLCNRIDFSFNFMLFIDSCQLHALFVGLCLLESVTVFEFNQYTRAVLDLTEVHEMFIDLP